MAKPTKEQKAVVSKLLKEMLGKPVPLDGMSQSQIDELAEGFRVCTCAEAVAQKIMQLASMGREWAIQVVLERTEGKAVQADKVENPMQTSEERLDHVTTQHLNALRVRLTQPAPAGGGSPPEAARVPAETGAAGPASKLLDLPKNGPRRSQDA